MRVQAVASSTRRYEVDWLRVLAILAVFIFHTGRFFDPEDWNVKNATTYPSLAYLAAFVTTWGMPLIFVISGASTFYALGKHKAGAFLKDRALRLLVPLAVGLFTHLAWQIYLDRLTHGRFTGSFIEFVPYYFNGLDGFGGNFPWYGIHLWYLELLFIYSLICLPLFVWLRRGSGQRFLAGLGDRLAFPGGLYLLSAPLVFLEVALDPHTIPTERIFSGWSMLGYVAIFVMGFVLVSHERLYDSARRLRWLSLAGAVAATVWVAARNLTSGLPAFGTAGYVEIYGLRALLSWGWIVAIVGFSAQHLRVPSRLLAYANEAVLPFYVMSQSVLLTVGYFVMPWSIPDLLKWAITGLGAFVVCMVLYEYLVRRVNVLRFLFGMKPLPAEPVMPSPIAVPGR